jgi:hypothetical protein
MQLTKIEVAKDMIENEGSCISSINSKRYGCTECFMTTEVCHEGEGLYPGSFNAYHVKNAKLFLAGKFQEAMSEPHSES